MVPEPVSDGVDPSNEYSATFVAGSGARRRDEVEDVELRLEIITDDDRPSGDDGETKIAEASLDSRLEGEGSVCGPVSNPVYPDPPPTNHLGSEP